MSRARAQSTGGGTLPPAPLARNARVEHFLDNTNDKVIEYRRDVDRCVGSVDPSLRVVRVDNNTSEATMRFELSPLSDGRPLSAAMGAALVAAVARDLGDPPYRVCASTALVAVTDARVAAFSSAITRREAIWCVERRNMARLPRSATATTALYALLIAMALFLLFLLYRMLQWLPGVTTAPLTTTLTMAADGNDDFF
jgi:hypothetical protein